MQMRRLVAAAIAAILMTASCVEQSPDKFSAPEFGSVDVQLSGLWAIVQCAVINAADNFDYGFVLEDGKGQSQKISIRPSGGKLYTELDALTPLTDYSIRAFATNGIYTVYSEEKCFRTSGDSGDEPGGEGGEEDEEKYVYMPDQTFRRLILNDYDTNGDGLLSMTEAGSIYSLQFCTDDISSIKGVECFTNLERIVCSGSDIYGGRRLGKLTTVDLSKNSRLRYVEVEGNKLTELLLPETVSNIEEIHCIYNKLQSLDLSGCPKLKRLWCWENRLTSLNLSNNSFLIDLSCAQNDFFGGLDVSANKELRYLACNDTGLQAIDLSANTELIEFLGWNNYIRTIDVSHNKNLVILECYNNMLSSIDVSMLPELETLSVGNNYIKEIDVSHNTKLRILECCSNLISSLDISMLSCLIELSVGGNMISEPLDLSYCEKLTRYDGNNLPLSRMPDFSHNPKLQGIHMCTTGGAEYMDEDFFRDWPEIREFNIAGYQGTAIDFSLNTKMETLWLQDIPNVKVFDLSASPNLRYICLNGDEKLEKVYVHKDVDISNLEVETDSRCHASIEHKK